MKVSLKGDKWVVKFDCITLEFNIIRVGDLYSVIFHLNNKIIKINTTNLDETFLSLNRVFKNKVISNQR
jgi:hypothetical protein